MDQATLNPPSAYTQATATAPVRTDTNSISQRKKVSTVYICSQWPSVIMGKPYPEVEGGFSPRHDAYSYLKDVKRESPTFPPLESEEIKVKPVHGQVYRFIHANRGPELRYVPSLNFTGTDRIETLVHMNERPVRVVYTFKVTHLPIDSDKAESLCGVKQKRRFQD